MRIKDLMNKNTLALVVVVSLIIASIIYLEGQKAGPVNIGDGIASEQGGQEVSEAAEPDLKDGKYPKAPELVGIVGYINTEEGLKISDLKGKVVLVDFWTYTCINCIRTFPHLTEWYKRYKDMGFVIIGVHSPEFGFEKLYENVKAATEKYGIEYPVVQDNNFATWQAYKNRFWPHKYLIDADGYIRYDHIGEGAYAETERRIQELLEEINMDVSDMGLSRVPDKTPYALITPELYAGYGFALPRGKDIGNPEGLVKDEIVDYKAPDQIKKDTIYLDGSWKSNIDNLEAVDSGASVILYFIANSVNIVADNLGNPLKLEVYIDNKYVDEMQAGEDVIFEDNKSIIIVDEPRLYNVFDGMFGRHTLQLTANETGFSFNAFTFG